MFSFLKHLSDLTLDLLYNAVVVLQPGVPRVQADLVPVGGDVEAADDEVLPPPEHAARHNKVLLLCLVPKKNPLVCGHVVVSEPCPPRHGHPGARLVTRSVSDNVIGQ